MNTPDSQAIVIRFFECVNRLIEMGELKPLIDFTNRHDIPRRAFYNSERDPSSNRFQVAWISYLVTDFNVSERYILTGKGDWRKRPVGHLRGTINKSRVGIKS